MNTNYNTVTPAKREQSQQEKYNQYKLMKYVLHKAMKYNFTVPANLHHELEYYKCLFWSVDYWKSQSNGGMTAREDKQFIEVYHGCTRGQVLDLLNDSKSHQLKLSFRAARKHWQLPAYVIVKIAATRPILKLEGNTYVTIK